MASIIPIYNIVVLLEMTGKPVWWVILMFIPIVNIAVSIVLWHSVSQSFGRDAWYTVGLFLFPYVFLPMLAFGDAVYTAPAGAATSTKGWVVAVVVAFVVVLFVVIFIGILSSIVLASLNTARTRGDDSIIRSKISFFRSDAELYFDRNGSYLGFCDSENVTSLYADPRIKDLACRNSSTTWAVSAALPTGGYTCADNTGVLYNKTMVPLGQEMSCSN